MGLYFWAYVSVDLRASISDSLLVGTPAAILAGVTTIVSFISWLWAPQRTIFPATLSIYFLLSATTIAMVLSTGGITSPFIGLWMVVAVFAGVFGVFGLAPLFLAVNTYLLVLYLNGDLVQADILTAVLVGELPLVASLIIWHQYDTDSEPLPRDPRAYKQLASELSEVAGKSEVVINAIGDAVLAIDSQGTIQLINPAAQQLLGWSKRDAMTLNYKSVLQLNNAQGNDLDSTTDPVQMVLNQNQEVRTNALSVVTKNGKKLLASIVVSPVGQSGSGVIVVLRDITKEKAEEREQAEFISTASHEMRTPVASIEGYLGLALNPNTATIDDKARSFIQKAHESVEHLGHLFQDLLDVSKAEDGRLSNNPKVVDIVQLVGEIVDGLRPKAAEKNLEIIYKPGDSNTSGERKLSPVYYVHLDNDHIREVVNNLTENAIKYTPAGTISIDITGDDERVVLSFADSGIGIPAEDIPHLFQKFYRVDNSDTREIGGTGLGLYLCRRLAEAMGGRIWVESEYKKGSTFYLELPRITNSQAEEFKREEEAKKAEAAERQTAAPSPIPMSTETTAIVTPPQETTALPTNPGPATTTPTAPVIPQPNLTPLAPMPPAPQPIQIEPHQEQSSPQVSPVPAIPTIPVAPEVPQTPSTPTTPAQPVSQPVNTPLSAIEQNPAAFTQRATPPRQVAISVPSRDTTYKR